MMLLVCDLVSTDLKIAMPYSYKRFVAVVLLLCVFLLWGVHPFEIKKEAC